MAGYHDPNHDSSGPSRYRPQSGIGHAPAYMVAGHPFLTSSALANEKEYKVAFPGASGDILRVSFRTQVDTTNLAVTAAAQYFQLDGDEESMTFNVKCKEIYIRNMSGGASGFQLYAELTGIPTSSMYVLTGSGISGTRGSEPGDQSGITNPS